MTQPQHPHGLFVAAGTGRISTRWEVERIFGAATNTSVIAATLDSIFDVLKLLSPEERQPNAREVGDRDSVTVA